MSERRDHRDPLMPEPGSLLNHSQPGRIVVWDPPVNPDVLARIRTELAFAEQRKYLAVPIDIADLKTLLAAVGGTP